METDVVDATATFCVYTRPGCHLCEDLIEQLLPLLRGRAELEVIDIDDDAELSRRYGTRIPVVRFQNELVCEYFLDRPKILRLLEGS